MKKSLLSREGADDVTVSDALFGKGQAPETWEKPTGRDILFGKMPKQGDPEPEPRTDQSPYAWGRSSKSSQSAKTGPRRTTPWDGGKVDEAFVVNGLVERGLPMHVAQAFAWNMQDESGFDPGINEKNPLVEGSRGGFGLYQLTGPRRRQYEEYAKERGVPFNDPDVQLDFLVMELETTEKGAAKHILSAGDANTAAVAVVERFLRPHESHRKSRSSQYMQRDAKTPASMSETTTSPNRLWLDF